MTTNTEVAPGVDFEPIDIYGNWKVTDIKLQPPPTPFGIEKGKSKFKIRNKGSKHVLIKKKNVGWNGAATEIALTEVTSALAPLFNANFRLRAIVTFKGYKYEVAFGSDDNGEQLEIQVLPFKDDDPITGGSGTAGRGG